ncbi:hypothetical protein PVK06_021013 [Gossypium arboreum]|uniref:Uncharacterized protein n=1 Tax=Gossypium arboreum TaxID=29729 RepID=A0ABR0PPB5_GOSAR|nr:hypothetical protein PVK06_021013 [Gossypium arboreum]
MSGGFENFFCVPLREMEENVDEEENLIIDVTYLSNDDDELFEAMIAIQEYNRIDNDNQRNKRKLKTNGGDETEELRRSNRGSTIEIKIERLALGFPPLFHRFYTCFDDLRRDFLVRCRPILGLDGCYLKGIAKGQLLTTVARDEITKYFL